MLRPVLDKIRKKRDIVMIDQRGTGQSNKLHCASEAEEDLNTEIDLEFIARETRKCLASLDADPRLYTTAIAMRDYDLVRRAMGYDSINVMGVSYGTRAAQVYLRQFPDAVRTVTLDSVIPMQLALGQEHARMLDKAVAEVFEDCRADETCNELYPGHENELNALLATLRESPGLVAPAGSRGPPHRPAGAPGRPGDAGHERPQRDAGARHGTVGAVQRGLPVH